MLEAICQARPDVVLMFLAGAEVARFNRAFVGNGLSAGILRFGLGVDETVHYAGGADASENLHAASNYVTSLKSCHNDRFLELYHDGFGEQAPPVSPDFSR
jgi:ABC-type branched-subunit amino acid transport system substrate-binding protein